ncbi:MAG: serine protease family protein [Planctomycetota bacterium]
MIRHIACAGLIAAGALALPGTVSADEAGDKMAAVLESEAPKIVTLEVVAKVSFGGRAGRERRMNIPGTLISESGLILTSDGPFGGNDFVKVSVESMKVIIERDEEAELEAFVVATDSKLHVAYVQIENLGDRKVKFVDLKSDATPSIGEPILQVSRKSKGFDFAPYFGTARIAGKIKKPRKVWEYDGNVSAGLPCFNLDGKVLGFVTQVESGLSRGGGESFLLPCRPIRASLLQAEKKAAEMLVTRAKEKAEGGAKKDDGDAKKDDAAKKDDEKKDDGAGKDDGDAKKDDEPKKDDGAGKSDGGK